MSEPGTPEDLAERYRPTILLIDDRIHPSEHIDPVPMEERFRDIPTWEILQYLEWNALLPDARAAALAELARRGVPPA